MKNLIILLLFIFNNNLIFCYEEQPLGFYPIKLYCLRFLKNTENVSNIIELTNELKYFNREWKIKDNTNIYYFWCEKDGTVKIWKNNVFYYILCLDINKMRP